MKPDEASEGKQTFVRVTNDVVYGELQAARADIRDLAARVADYPELKTRVARLEIKVYGLLAGLVAAVAAFIKFGTWK